MSVIAGFVSDSEVNAGRVQAFVAAISQPARRQSPDGFKVRRMGNAVMFYGTLQTTEQHESDSQPVTSPCHLLAWNGRLDNRREVAGLIGEERRAPEAQLVLHAYDRFGADAFSRLVGDFSFSLWDARTRQLFLVRDALGMRRMFYFVRGRHIVWSTHFELLLHIPQIPLEIDEEFVAGFLSWSIDPDRSPFKAIKSVPPAHYLVATEQAISLRRFWEFEARGQFNYSRDEQYEEHFRDLFAEAVQKNLNTRGPVWSELSGGMDSTSIVCVADELRRTHKVGQTAVQTVSYVFDYAPQADERRLIELVETQRGVPGHRLNEERCPIFKPPTGHLIPFPSGAVAFHSRYEAVWRLMRESGARVLLRGIGGDQVSFGDYAIPLEPADQLARGRPIGALKSAAEWSLTERKTFLRTLWESGVMPVLPVWAQQPVRKLSITPVPWIDHEFAKRTGMAERLSAVSREALLPSVRQQAAWLRDLATNVLWGDSYLELEPIEARHPFLYRPLVEFCLELPLRQKLRPGETRSIVRRAMKGIVPQDIRARAAKSLKTGHDQAIYQAMARERFTIEDLLTAPLSVEFGWVNGNALRERVRAVHQGGRITWVYFLRFVGLEWWLQSYASFSNRRPDKDTPASTIQFGPLPGPASPF